MESNITPLHLKIRYRKREFLCYLNSLFRKQHSSQRKVIIFAQGRSGSTVLESLLNSTGYFKKYMEILSTRVNEPFSPYHYLRGLLLRAYPQNFIFHLKIYHLTTDRKRQIDPKKFLQKLEKDDWSFIYLKRENKVEQVISNLIAEHRGSYEKHDSIKEDIRLNVDCDRFIIMLKQREEYSMQEENIMTNIPHIQVSYESDLKDSKNHINTVNRILTYLNMEKSSNEDITTTYKKLNSDSISDLVENYDELYEVLKSNNWLHYLT